MSRGDADTLYAQLKTADAQSIINLMRGYPPLWDAVKPLEFRLPDFIDEFLRCGEIRERQEKEAESEE
jgi:hypothetical protein